MRIGGATAPKSTAEDGKGTLDVQGTVVLHLLQVLLQSDYVKEKFQVTEWKNRKNIEGDCVISIQDHKSKNTYGDARIVVWLPGWSSNEFNHLMRALL